MVYFIDASYIFFPPKTGSSTISEDHFFGSGSSRQPREQVDGSFRKLRLQFHFMTWYPLTTHPHSLNICNHVCVFVCMCV